MKATIYKSTGSFYLACDEQGKMWQCRIRGRLKIDGAISSTNPIAVGDTVTLQTEDGDASQATISAIGDRHNYMVRTSPHNKHQKHIVAANIDLALLVATVKNPRTSFGFIDRFLVTAEAYHIPVTIVMNKADLIAGKVVDEWLEKKGVYEQAGYKIMKVAATEGAGLAELGNLLQDKTTLFSGHSGVGKSTLIGHFLPEKDIKIQQVSHWSGKGQHTTTFAEMYDLPGGGRIIDTPGVKEFGIVDMDTAELSHYFPEMKERLPHCKFNNCMHINEPGCAVKGAVATGKIPLQRYDSYLSIAATLS
ncbi:MAG: ribosome small subunit-dependent GTPase A [Edaphocola sp.]